jgi:adenylate cyclase
VDWLVDGARSTMQAHRVLAELCDRLVGCGIPLWRVAVFVRTLHPHIMGRRFIWRPGAEIEVRDAPFDLLETAEFRGSPVAKVYATGTPIRRRLAEADCPIDFPMLRELRDEGVSDYLASPLLFTDGEIQLATWTMRQAGGFTDAQIEGIKSIIAPLARVAAAYEARGNVAALNQPIRTEIGVVRFGLALHIGKVCTATLAAATDWISPALVLQ